MTWLERIRRAFDPDGSVATSGGPPARAAFIVACPRSGTTWLRQALNAHPEIACVEKRLFGKYCDLVHDAGAAGPRVRITLDRYVDALAPVVHGADLPVAPEELNRRVADGFIRALDDLLRSVTGKRLLVDKLTPYAGTAEPVAAGIRRHYPQARIIHLVRDGRDVATSGVFHWLNLRAADEAPDPIRDRRRAYFLGTGGPAFLPRFFSDADLDYWCDLWTTALRVAELLAPAFPLLTVHYEEMIRDLPTVLRRVFAFLEADASGTVLRDCAQAASFETMSGGRARGQEIPTAHVRKGVVGDWQNYFTRQDAELFQRRAGQHLLALGCVPDDTWPAGLPEVLTLSRAASSPSVERTPGAPPTVAEAAPEEGQCQWPP